MRFSVLNSVAERRDGLKALLRQIDRGARFSDAQDWRHADRMLRRFKTDLLVIDWEADWMRINDARALFAAHPTVSVAVLTDDASPATVRKLIDEGVLGVIPRQTDLDLIVRAFEMALLGGHYVPAGALDLESPPPPNAAVRQIEAGNPKPQRARLTNELSPRQEQIMRCVHMGSTNKMIARTLGISEGTVKIHLTSIFQQLGAPNRAAAVAIYNGWLASQLEVLRSGNKGSPQPALGQPGTIPLRRRPNRRFKYPLQANDDDGAVANAAEPTVPFGGKTPESPQ